MLLKLQIYVEKIENSDTDEKAPNTDSYRLVKRCLEDPLLDSKLAFFITIANDMEPFLREFQTDAPMLPFLHSGVSIILILWNVLLRKRSWKRPL